MNLPFDTFKHYSTTTIHGKQRKAGIQVGRKALLPPEDHEFLANGPKGPSEINNNLDSLSYLYLSTRELKL
jgi:hypothetical protein